MVFDKPGSTFVRIALVHDWVHGGLGMRGGESVLQAMAECVPTAELFTLLYIPGGVPPAISGLKRHTSFIQKMPRAERYYRHYLPLMPSAIERLDVSAFDLILSSSHCVAKGVRKREGALHISYVHAPMRYIWDRFDEYFGPGRAGWITRLGANLMRKRLQEWDRKSAAGVDRFLANSHYIAGEIGRNYGRKATVVHPHVDLERFQRPRETAQFYLMVGAMAPYKRVDIAIEAFRNSGQRLYIVGDGQERKRLERGKPDNVEFLGKQPHRVIEELFAKCKAFVFPGKEDFGITPLEAMASGAPVIALNEGGACETVVHGETGLLYEQGKLAEAIALFESGQHNIDEIKCRQRAGAFSKTRFQEAWIEQIKFGAVEAGFDLSNLDHFLKRPASTFPLGSIKAHQSGETKVFDRKTSHHTTGHNPFA